MSNQVKQQNSFHEPSLYSLLSSSVYSSSGTLCSSGAELKEDVSEFTVYDSTLAASRLDLADLSQFRENMKQQFYWFDFRSPKASDLAEICGLFFLHAITEADLKDRQGERVQFFPNYLFMIINQFLENDEELPVAVLLLPQLILTFHVGPIPFIPDMLDALKPVSPSRIGSGWIFFGLIFHHGLVAAADGGSHDSRGTYPE